MLLNNRKLLVTFIILGVSLILLGLWWWRFNTAVTDFNGGLAFRLAEAQMKFGPRPTGSEANRQTGDFILEQLKQQGWQTETQEFTYRNTPARNIIGKAAIGQGPVIIIGAHYDTRLYADQDPVTPLSPLPGANDGASGVAVLLELARTLDTAHLQNEVWLAFFDAEDNGDINGWDWIVGSTYMAQSLSVKPQAMILVDMIGDSDQQIYFDTSSDPALSAQLFGLAAQLGYAENFIAQPKYAMLDDHTPFANLGIPSVDLIDFDYPHWHRTTDTLDKLSPQSLERVGRTLEVYLEKHDQSP
jgi:Zn-dependent M28 family amino/carboxypeptidase